MLDREFFLGFVKCHILYHASKEPVFGAEMAEELKQHGYYLGPGSLYPTLHRLESEGYLKQQPKVVGGKLRKYYTITEQGLAALNEARHKIRELVEEVLEDRCHKQTDK